MITTPSTASVPRVVVESVRVLWRSDLLAFPRHVRPFAEGLVVADLTRLHFLTAGGDYVRSEGREGDGPGEFRTLLTVFTRADTLFAYDSRLLRLSSYDRDGRHVTSRRLEPHAGFPTPNREIRSMRPVAGGVLYPARHGTVSIGTPLEAAVLWRDLEADSVAVLGSWIDLRFRFEGGYLVDEERLGPRARLAVGPDGRWAYGDGLEYCVSVARLGLAAVTRICREWDRADVPPGVRDPDFDALWARVFDPPAPEQIEGLETAYRSQAVASSFPSYDHLWFAEEGDLWVRIFDDARTAVPPTIADAFPELRPPRHVWDVFDVDGAWVRTIELPSRFAPRWIGKGRAYGFYTFPIGDVGIALADLSDGRE